MSFTTYKDAGRALSERWGHAVSMEDMLKSATDERMSVCLLASIADSLLEIRDLLDPQERSRERQRSQREATKSTERAERKKRATLLYENIDALRDKVRAVSKQLADDYLYGLRSLLWKWVECGNNSYMDRFRKMLACDPATIELDPDTYGDFHLPGFGYGRVGKWTEAQQALRATVDEQVVGTA